MSGDAGDLPLKILKTLVDAAKDDRGEALKEGREVDEYAYGRKFEDDFKDWPGPQPAFRARVSKMAQAIDLFGPYLYPSNPTRKVTPKPWVSDDVRIRAQWMEQYLNYTPNETDLYGENLRCINEGLIYGRSVMWTGYDPKKQLCLSVMDSVRNYLVDPDARTMREVNWKGRLRYRPRWQLLKRYPQAAQVILDTPACSERNSDRKNRSDDPSTDIIEYVEMYAMVGLHNYKQGFALADESGAADDSPRKYVFTEKGIIQVGTWEVPLFRDGTWPCTELDFREMPEGRWPRSPLALGLPHQKALNWLYATMVTKAPRTLKTVWAILQRAGVDIPQASLEKIIKASADDSEIPVIPFEWEGSEDGDIRKIVQQMHFELGMQDFERLWAIVERQFEEQTGLYAILHAGEAQRQMRSAEEVRMRESSSRTRINYYKERVERHQGQIARKEALYALFLQPRDVIASIFGPEAAAQFGEIMAPEEAAMTPFGVDFEAAMRESDYEIESGSMAAKTPEQARMAADMFLERALAPLMSAGQIPAALAGLAMWAKENGLPQGFQDVLGQSAQMAMLPPPMPAGPGAAPIPGPGAQLPTDPAPQEVMA